MTASERIREARTLTELGYALKREAELSAEVLYGAQRCAQHLDALLDSWADQTDAERLDSVREARLRIKP